MKTKIAIIIERADVALGGAERSVFELTEAISETGLDAHILAARGRSQSENVHILCPGFSGGRTGYGTFESAIKRHLAENNYDIIHSVLPYDFADIYQPRGGTYAEAILQNAASYCNVFLEFWKRATGFANFRRAELFRAERKLCGMADGPVIIAISKYVAEQFGRHYGIEAGRIVVIPNGVKPTDVADKMQAERIVQQAFAQLKINGGDRPAIFLFAANNFRLKGLGCLLKAMRLVSQRDSSRPVFLVVAGGDRTAAYERMAVKLGVDRNILFLGKLEHIADALAAADVAILPTFYDPCSRFILEALAAGKPVITTKFNGAIDLFVGNRHGKVIDDPRDITALSEAIGYFANRDNLHRAANAIISDDLRQNVSIARVAQQLKTVYGNILAERGRR